MSVVVALAWIVPSPDFSSVVSIAAHEPSARRARTGVALVS